MGQLQRQGRRFALFALLLPAFFSSGCLSLRLAEVGRRAELPERYTAAHADDQVLIVEYEGQKYYKVPPSPFRENPTEPFRPTGALVRRWASVTREPLLENRPPDVRIEPVHISETLRAGTRPVPIFREGSPGDDDPFSELAVFVETRDGRDVSFAVVENGPEGQRAARVRSTELARRYRERWAYPLLVIGVPVAVALDVSLVIGLLLAWAYAESDDDSAAGP